MSLHGITKDTELKDKIEQYWNLELQGVGIYYTLSRLAKEQGFDDVAQTLIGLGNDEARHAGLYGTLNGKMPVDFFKVLEQAVHGEENGMLEIKKIVESLKGLGLAQAAAEVDAAANDEGHHAQVLKNLLQKYKKD